MSGTLSQGPGGGIISPGQAGVGNPMQQQMVQRMAQVPTEQLQEMAARAGSSPQGQMAARILQQRHMMPNAQQQPASGGIAQTPQATAAGVALPPTTNAMRRGGGIAPMTVRPSPMVGIMARAPHPPRQHFDIGGMPSSQETPWWTRSEARESDSGLIHGFTPGRTDTINMEPLAGSYVIPADVISGLGEGNTLAGAAAMDRVLSTGPRGIPMPRGEHGRGPPAPPRQPAMHEAAGGSTGNGRVPIIAAGGEYTVSPDQVRALGRGNIKRGHDLLDAFVLEIRRRTIKDLRKLPAPKKK
jgi:hypothetical protein